MKQQPLIAAVDLGSNSFRLQVARVVDDQIYPLDSLREAVRLAAGIPRTECRCPWTTSTFLSPAWNRYSSFS